MNKNDGIVVVSTFDGMGCMYSALKRQGIKVKKYFSYEIDKYAMQAAKTLHPDIEFLGDITKASLKDFRGLKVDLYSGGSPCQGFSFAGKQLAFDDPRSKLFFDYVRLWNEIKKSNPDAKFLLENVQMKKNELRIISEYMGVFPVNINSNLQSAQNRNRWYWSNIRTKDVGLFSENWVDIPQPKDKGILLKDILQPENEVDEKYYIKTDKRTKKMLKRILDNVRSENEKGNCLLATSYKGSASNGMTNIVVKLDKQLNIKADQSKAGCLTAGGNSGGNHSDMDIICVSMVGRRLDENGIRKDNDKSIKAVQQLEPNEHGKTNCLTSVSKDNLLTDGYKLRRLTPRECGRLQTFTEHELDILLNAGIYDTQLYKMFGNGWTIEPISHILSFY